MRRLGSTWQHAGAPVRRRQPTLPRSTLRRILPPPGTNRARAINSRRLLRDLVIVIPSGRILHLRVGFAALSVEPLLLVHENGANDERLEQEDERPVAMGMGWGKAGGGGSGEKKPQMGWCG